MLAGVGIGWFDSAEAACRELVTIADAAPPSDAQPSYAESYARYRTLYPALAPTFHAFGSS
jgi:sugar (pentulose or hexulose) kinase